MSVQMKMSRLDDLKAALECRQPEGAVPLWELEFHLWDQASGKHVILGQEFQQLAAGEQERALHSNAEIILSVCEEFSFAGLTPPTGFWEWAPGVLAYYVLPEQARWEQLRILREMAPPDLMFISGSGGVITPPSQGYEEFAFRLYDAPDEVEDMARRTCNDGIEAAKRLRDAGCGAASASADIADNHGPYFTPAQMKRFVLPYMREWAEGVKALGLYPILHSDGNLTSMLDDLADSGLSALQAVDPIAGMDIAEAKRKVEGRLCLCGNIDCGLLHLGPPAQVYETTKETLASCKPGGGFVLGASNAVFRETPIEHYREMIRAWRDHGQY
jgi:uroporphyrinogen decarboxylase